MKYPSVWGEQKQYSTVDSRMQNSKINGFYITGQYTESQGPDSPVDGDILTASTSLTVTSTFIAKNLGADNFINPIYYELFMQKDGTNYDNYWLASRATGYNSYQIIYSIRCVENSCLDNKQVVRSMDGAGSRWARALRPVVTLPASVVIGSSGNGTSDSPWGIN